VLALEANSMERLEMFLETLAALGAEPGLVARSTAGSAEEPARLAVEPSDPAGGDRPGMSPEAFNAWARTWADEAVPALEGTTPRLPPRMLVAVFRWRPAPRPRVPGSANRARGLGHVDVAEFRPALGVSAGARPKLGADRPI
jgi:hypothetical protein